MRLIKKTPTPTFPDRFFDFVENHKISDKLIFFCLLLTFVTSGLFFVRALDQSFITTIPSTGGTFIEGVIGSPRFVNPVLAITRADHDLVALTYSGLLKLGPSGELENDLASSVTISEDGLVYNVILKDDQYFHDGTKVKAEDVVFTIGLIQEPELKSPLRGNWSGVTVEYVSEYEVNFVLESPYAPFTENLTVGILPKHVWDTLSNEELPFSQHNTEPIGSGPYQLKNIKRNPAGLINEYELTAASRGNSTAKIENVTVRFYQNEEELITALNKKEITGTASLSEYSVARLTQTDWNIIKQPLPRVFSIFFNQNKTPALRDESVREALEILIDRQAIVDIASSGYGSPTALPIPPGFHSIESSYTTSTTKTKEEKITQAKEILFDAGWVLTAEGSWVKKIDEQETPLKIVIRSANTPVFEKTASYLENTWKELGVDVSIELFEQSDLVQTVIRPRDYQVLLFGIESGRALDLYPFWHSSQREDPGLNVSLYTNLETDKLLQDMRTQRDPSLRNESLKGFVDILMEERPVISLFSPTSLYVLEPAVKPEVMNKVMRSSERFSNINNWYMKESQVWPIFSN
jgi:peptide/nickel transport system substrate-binding protein